MAAHISIQHEEFDVNDEIAALTEGREDIGAVVTFSGHVRGDGGLVSMTLEHYAGMTEREIARHVEEAGRRWPLLGATVIHRVGKLTPGAPIVLVVVASSHRAAAFEAAEFLMDYLKTRAPFWKEEERQDGSAWVEARESDAQSAGRWHHNDEEKS
jgi:molybdopterin synthase catalytic subunit